MVQRAGVVGKALAHHGHHVLRDPVGRKAGRFGHGAGAFGTKALAVFGVKVPLSALGFFARHQHAVAFTHLAIEEFHAQLFFALGPVRKLGSAAQKMRVGYPAQRHLGLGGGVFNQFFHAPFAGLQHHQFIGAQLLQGVKQARGKIGRRWGRVGGVFLGGRVHLHIYTGPTAAMGLVGKVPHARQKQRNAGLVVPNLVGFTVGLDHQQLVLRRVKTRQSRTVPAQLVA